MAHYELIRKATDGLSLYFQGWQTEQYQRGVICLVHGLGEHSSRYAHWAELLNQAGYTVLAYDLRGHGKSGGKRGHINSFEEFLNDTDMLMKEAEDRYPGTKRFLYGHSLGSIIVSSYVLHRKPGINGVVLTGLATKTALSEQKVKIVLAKILGSIVPHMSMASGLDPAAISTDPEIVSIYIHDPLVHAVTSLGFGKNSLEEIEWIEQHASEWTLPILLMHGEKDRVAYVEGTRIFSEQIRGDRTLKIWPGMYHEVHNEPEKLQVFEFLRDWLDEHSKSD